VRAEDERKAARTDVETARAVVETAQAEAADAESRATAAETEFAALQSTKTFRYTKSLRSVYLTLRGRRP
jgi:outer membrane protein TolC